MPEETESAETGEDRPRSLPLPVRYAIPFGVVALATTLSLALPTVVSRAIYIFYFPAVFVGAIYGGLWPAVLTAILSVLAANFFLVPPQYSLAFVPAMGVRAAIMLIVGGLAGWLSARATRAAEESASLRERQRLVPQLQDAYQNLQIQAEELQVQSDELTDANNELRARQADLAAANDALRLNEARLQTIVENLTEGLVVSDLQGNLLHWNRAAVAMHGFAREAEGQRELSALADTFQLATLDGIPLPVAEWPLSRILRGEEIRDLDLRVRRIGSDWERVFSYGGTLVRDPDGRPLMAIVTVDDVTERRRTEEEIRRLNAELEQRVVKRTEELRQRAAELEAANKELEAFSYSVSHDLRTPLRSIDGFSKILLEDYSDVVDATGQDYLKRVRAAAQRMGRLIDDILQLSRATRAEMRRGTVDLSAMAADIVAELRQADPDRQAEITIEPGMVVDGDANLLRIVLQNLLGNAWKFTRERTPARIEFATETRDGERAYCVRDNGAGFDMAYVERLFGAFQRLHTEAEFPGTGIGLALVKRIVRRHGGRVWAEGAVGQGATFCFTLARREE